MSNWKNSVRLSGFLGGAPEMKTTGNNRKIARVSLAIPQYRRNTAGERVRETQWHQLVLWEKQAEMAAQCLDKGNEISIEGRLVSRSYVDKNGIKRQVTEVIVSILLLPLNKQTN